MFNPLLLLWETLQHSGRHSILELYIWIFDRPKDRHCAWLEHLIPKSPRPVTQLLQQENNYSDNTHLLIVPFQVWLFGTYLWKSQQIFFHVEDLEIWIWLCALLHIRKWSQMFIYISYHMQIFTQCKPFVCGSMFNFRFVSVTEKYRKYLLSTVYE